MKSDAFKNYKFYSVGLLQDGSNFKIVDSYLFQKVNQHRQDWYKVNSRSVARQLNRGKLVIS